MIINIEGLEDLALFFKTWYFEPLLDGDPTMEALVHLLEVIAKRCPCLTLGQTATHLHTWKPYIVALEKEAQKWRSRSPPNNLGPFKLLRKRLSLGISRSRSPHVSDTYPHRSSALKTLVFLSETFLLPPFSGWAFGTLNTARLTRLDLIEVTLFSHVSALIFGALTIPTLEHLRIISCRFEHNAFAEFLSRHNTISTFNIIFYDVYRWQLLITTLLALVSLKSQPHYIHKLLTPTGAFPKLAHVRLVIHLSSSGQFMFDDVEMSLSRVAKRLTETNIRLCLDILPAPHTNNSVNLETLPNDLRNHPVLSRVREINFGVPHQDVFTITAIRSWSSMFPLLEHIEFLECPRSRA
jgi:hypothetical protein